MIMVLGSPHNWMRLVESSTMDVSGAAEVPQSRGKSAFWALFLKRQISARLRHLRSTWDIHIRAFDEAHPTVRGSKHHYHYLGSYCPLDAPLRELFIRIFKSAVALSVSRQIDFLCVCFWWPIQLIKEDLKSCDVFEFIGNEIGIPYVPTNTVHDWEEYQRYEGQ